MDLGAHSRWCPERVGPIAARFGALSERAESLADAIGGLHPNAANHVYRASEDLRVRATREASAWKATR
jgi:hypothetical protein